MTTITIKNLTIQVDIHKAHGNLVADAQTAIDLINKTLSNGFLAIADLNAKILNSDIDADDVELNKKNEEETAEIKQEHIDRVIERIKSDVAFGDVTAINELLMCCPIANLKSYLPEYEK